MNTSNTNNNPNGILKSELTITLGIPPVEPFVFGKASWTENYAYHLKQLYFKLDETNESLVLVITSDVHGKHNEIIENIGIPGKDEVTGYLHNFIQTVIKDNCTLI